MGREHVAGHGVEVSRGSRGEHRYCLRLLQRSNLEFLQNVPEYVYLEVKDNLTAIEEYIY